MKTSQGADAEGGYSLHRAKGTASGLSLFFPLVSLVFQVYFRIILLWFHKYALSEIVLVFLSFEDITLPENVCV